MVEPKRRQLAFAADGDDVIEARVVAEILGLSHPNSVSIYQRRYTDMPRPVIDVGQSRCKLWLRSGVEAWKDARPD